MNKPDLPRLVAESRFIFVGTAARQDPGHPHSAAASGSTTPVRVDEILQSTDVLRGLAGKQVLVVSEHPDELHGTLLLFSNGLVYGDHVVVQEVGHHEARPEAIREVKELLRAEAERPLRERISSAALIVTGTVVSSTPAGKPSIRRSEHDPDWWIARVKVQSVLKGKPPQHEVEVLFAHSTDIAWYKAPKLEDGASGIFLLHHVHAKDAPPEVGRAIYEVIDPLDFLPADRLADVRRMLDQGEEER